MSALHYSPRSMFSTKKTNDDDLYNELHAEFESHATEYSADTNDTTSSGIFGNLSMNLGEMDFPNVPLTGDVECSWIPESEFGNPFTFNLLDISPVVYEYDSTNGNAVTSHASSENPFNIEDRPVGEIYESFANISNSLNLSNNLEDIISQSQNDAEEVVDGLASSDARTNFEDVPESDRRRSKHHRIKFDPPIIIRHIIPDSILTDARGVFCAPIKIGSEDMPEHFRDMTAPPPPLRTLNRASLSNGRYDSYISGNDGRMLFFASNVNMKTREMMPKNEMIALERHHVLTLSVPPKMIAAPLHIMRMQMAANTLLGDSQTNSNQNPNAVMSASQADAEGFEETPPFSHILELRIDSSTSTYAADCPLGTPSSDRAFRAREADFLIRNAVFGLALPAPVPPMFQAALSEDSRGTLSAVESQKRREAAARTIVALYGKGTNFASIESPLQYPCAKSEFLENDPHNLIYYDNPANHFTGNEASEQDPIFESIFGDLPEGDATQARNVDGTTLDYDEFGNLVNVETGEVVDDGEYFSDESSESDVDWNSSDSDENSEAEVKK